MNDPEIKRLKQEASLKLFEYITFLEQTNDELLNTVKQCTILLSMFKEDAPDPKGFQLIIDDLIDTVKAGERIVRKETLH